MTLAEGYFDQNTASCQALSLGRVDYLRIWELQKALAQRVAEGLQPHTLLLLEHPHVYTLGRRGKETDLLVREDELAARGVAVHWVDRGGEATYHGPGQLVGYPILHLRELGTGPLEYVHTLEQVLIGTLADFGINAGLVDGLTGVWVDERKIAAIGVKISRGVTTHGFALNVAPDLSFFDGIVPCGIADKGVTSMELLLDRPIDVKEVIPRLMYHFGQEFALEMRWAAESDTLLEIVYTHLQESLLPQPSRTT